MKDNDIVFVLLLIIAMAAAAAGALVALVLTENQYRHEALERDYAEYCTKTGEWAWKGECDEHSR